MESQMEDSPSDPLRQSRLCYRVQPTRESQAAASLALWHSSRAIHDTDPFTRVSASPFWVFWGSLPILHSAPQTSHGCGVSGSLKDIWGIISSFIISIRNQTLEKSGDLCSFLCCSSFSIEPSFCSYWRFSPSFPILFSLCLLHWVISSVS